MWLKIEKALHWSSRAFASLSMVSIFLMMIFVGVDVFLGYAFKAPLPGSIDFVVIMMVVLIFPTLAYLTQLDAHVRTDILYDKLSKRGKDICNIPTTIFGIILVGIMAWRLGLRIWVSITQPPGLATAYFNWPQWPFMLLGLIGLVLMTLELVIQLVHAVHDTLNGENVS